MPDGWHRRENESRQLVEQCPDGTRIGEVLCRGGGSQFVANPRDGLVVPVKAQTPEGQSVGEEGYDEQDKGNCKWARREGGDPLLKIFHEWVYLIVKSSVWWWLVRDWTGVSGVQYEESAV